MTKKEQAILDAPEIGYYFSEEGHLHLLDRKPLTGITTILGVIAKPALIQWAADEAVKHLGWFNEKYEDKEKGLAKIATRWSVLKEMESEAFYNLLCEARTQHAKRKKSAGDIGTEVHAQIEEMVKVAIKDFGGRIPYINQVIENEQVKKMVDKFVAWAHNNNVKCLESEKHLYSKEMWTGGICDLVFEIDGQVWIGDIKTASGIYPENMAQMAGYDLMLKEMGLYENITGYCVLNLRKDGTFEEKRSVSNEDNQRFFKACLDIYRLQEKINNQII